MSNPIFDKLGMAQLNSGNNILQLFNSIKQAANGNIGGLANTMLQNNPQFSQFIQASGLPILQRK